MSSPPSPRDFDGLIAETWGAHALTRPDVMALLEPYREHVDRLMDDFDDNEHSWRDYCGAIYGWGRGAPCGEGAIPITAQDAVVELLKQPAPTAAPVTPTLHGLTLVQLEAVRGYVETVGSVARMMSMSKTLAKAGSPVSLLDRRPLVQGLAAARALAESPNGTPYSEGARFALAQESIAESITTIEARLREAR